MTSKTLDDFGYGWRMEFRDTDLKVSLKRDLEMEELGFYPAFKEKTRVYITLPGGKREAFTFKPKPEGRLNFVMQTYGFRDSAALYHPAFEADKGVTSTLSVRNADDTYITRSLNTNQYSGLVGSGYNPADPYYGGVYVLTTKEGTVYEIDARTGDLLTVSDPNGNTLSYTDDAVTSSTGKTVTFERDAQGRIASVKDPIGDLIRYEYNSTGDLVSVTDREGNTTRMEYSAGHAHYLDKIIDPLGRTGAKTEYDDNGRLKQMVDVNGKAINISYDSNNSAQTVADQLGYATTYVYDERGNVTQELDARGGVILRTYDENNNLLSETDADGVTTQYTYDRDRNLLTIEDEAGRVTRMTYNDRGRTTAIVSPTGLTVTAKYDSDGNLLESIDTDGLKTTYSYSDNGQLRFQTAPDGQVAEYDYDRFGNPNKMVDSRGNVVNAVYDLNGRMGTTQVPLC